MKTYPVTAKKKIGDEELAATVNIDFGETVEELVEQCGAEVVVSNAIANFKITAQAAIRRGLERGDSEEKIQEDFAGWKPGVAIARTVDPMAAAAAKFANMSPEEQADFIKQLKAKAGKK